LSVLLYLRLFGKYPAMGVCDPLYYYDFQPIPMLTQYVQR